MKILVGIPAYNEEKSIAPLLVKLQKFGYEIVVCDDASSDVTSQIAEKFDVKVIKHEKNRGYGGAIQSIFKYAREKNAEILVTFDGDGQHDPKYIETLIQPVLDKKSDIVIGSRFLEQDSKIPKYREIGIKTLTKLATSTDDLDITDSQSGLRAYNKTAIDNLKLTEDGMGISTEILIKASQQKLQFGEIPIVMSYEGDTSTENPASHGVSVATTTIKHLSIKHPLLFFGLPGLFSLGIGLVFAIWTVSNFAATRMILTNVAIISVGTIIAGLMLLMAGIMLFTIISVVRERQH